MTIFTAACIQMRSGTEVAPNITAASDLIRQAAAKGAKLIATPEMTSLLDIRAGQARGKIVSEGDDLALKAFRALVSELGVWLLIGSIAVKHETDSRYANRSFLIAPDGAIAARYDKIHMFDVEVGDGQSYRESKAYRPGDKAVLAETDFGKIGLSVCYDVRFPHLYRALSQAGAEILTVPAAFTRVTGKAHWHTLLKARAIETGSFVLAPAQGGTHEDGRETYGHSLIISPWGTVLAELDHDEPGIILAKIDTSDVTAARKRIPALSTNAHIAVVTA